MNPTTRIRFHGVAANEIITSSGMRILCDPFLDQNPGALTKSGDFDKVDPRETALMEGEAPELEEPADPAVESVTVTDYEADTIRLHVTATARGMVVLSEIWDPGWSATVDGNPEPVIRATLSERAVPVMKGRHEIRFTYDPPGVRTGLRVSLFSLAALVIWTAAATVFGRRHAASPR